MIAKKNRFIFEDLAWLEQKLLEYKQYLDDPINKWENLKDRTVQKMTKNGGVTDMLAASKEKQMESMLKFSKEIYDLLLLLNEKRKEEDKVQELKGKGNTSLPAMMRQDEPE